MSKPLRVVHITSAHKDGDVRIFHKECVSLAAAGFDVFLVVPNAKSRLEKGVNIVSFEDSGSSRFRRAIRTVNRVYETAIELDGDIYHLHDPELLRIAKRFKEAGKKVIYDAHEDLPRQIMSKPYIPVFLRKTISWFTEINENRIAKKLDGVITATPFIRDRFLNINSTTEDINNFPLISEVEIQSHLNSKREKAICYIGAISDIRGISELIHACGIAKIKLYLAGEMEPGLLSKYSQMEAWKFVEYLGHVDRDKSLQLKKNCFAGVVPFLAVPNHVNAQPNKLFEYMGSGLPVICSDFPLWKLIIEVNECGVCVDCSNPEILAQAIIDLSENTIAIDKMGTNGIRQVTQKYNWEIEKQKLIEFYQKLAANGK